MSRETVACPLTVLRLTRWIHLAGRDPNNIYAVYDAPLPFIDVCNLDSGYLDLLTGAFAHAILVVRRVAQDVL